MRGKKAKMLRRALRVAEVKKRLEDEQWQFPFWIAYTKKNEVLKHLGDKTVNTFTVQLSAICGRRNYKQMKKAYKRGEFGRSYFYTEGDWNEEGNLYSS